MRKVLRLQVENRCIGLKMLVEDKNQSLSICFPRHLGGALISRYDFKWKHRFWKSEYSLGLLAKLQAMVLPVDSIKPQFTHGLGFPKSKPTPDMLNEHEKGERCQMFHPYISPRSACKRYGYTNYTCILSYTQVFIVPLKLLLVIYSLTMSHHFFILFKKKKSCCKSGRLAIQSSE